MYQNFNLFSFENNSSFLVTYCTDQENDVINQACREKNFPKNN